MKQLYAQHGPHQPQVYERFKSHLEEIGIINF